MKGKNCLANLVIKLCNFKMDVIKWQIIELRVVQFWSEITPGNSNWTGAAYLLQLQSVITSSPHALQTYDDQIIGPQCVRRAYDDRSYFLYSFCYQKWNLTLVIFCSYTFCMGTVSNNSGTALWGSSVCLLGLWRPPHSLASIWLW